LVATTSSRAVCVIPFINSQEIMFVWLTIYRSSANAVYFPWILWFHRETWATDVCL